MIALSVRSALLVYLKTMNFSKGMQVVMSAVNIPALVDILKFHGLVPVPIDFDLNTFELNLCQFESSLSDQTAFILVAHIYGKVFDVSKLIPIAKARGIPFIEDNAEAFCGFQKDRGYMGHPGSDLVLFSFGAMKTSTALGGAVALVRDTRLCRAMRRVHCSFKVQSRSELLTRNLRYLLLMSFLNSPRVLSLMNWMFEVLSYDLTGIGVSMLRSFKAGDLEHMQKQPSPFLTKHLFNCLKNFSASDLKPAEDAGKAMLSNLPLGAAYPGSQTLHRFFWLFPILVENPQAVADLLRKKGILAHRGVSQLNIVKGDSDKDNTKNAQFLIDHLMYVPVHRNVPLKDIPKIAMRIAASISQVRSRL